MKTQTVKSISNPPVVTDGVGCQIRRIVQGHGATDMDPFLLFDYFSATYPAGFYDHPHRGFEMATYIIKGSVIHEDFHGNKTILGPGDYSWTNIGRGVVHSEMPASSTEESVGFILWTNVPKEEKFSEYSYDKFEAATIPTVDTEGVKVKVLAGKAFKLEGPKAPRTDILILDVDMQDECIFEHIIPKGWNSLCFVYEGSVNITSPSNLGRRWNVPKDHAATLDVNKQDKVLHIETQDENARFLLIAGKPLNEPVHQHGPFVLATQKDLKQTFEDYNLGINGFEGAKEFKSELGRKLEKN